MISQAILDAIQRAAAEQGIDPSTALAIAQRESSFNPQARSSKTIRGMFQMMGEHRAKYGVGDSNDPYTQANGWGKFFNQVKRDMAAKLGREPTDAEGYLGHHFGAARAARMMVGDPNTPVDQVFSRNEMALNPHFARAGTVGRLNSTVLADIDKKSAAFGGGGFNDTLDFPGLDVDVASLVQPPTGADPNPVLEERKFEAPAGPANGPSNQGPKLNMGSKSISGLDFSDRSIDADDH